jgi:MinD-like ATPase involved in chromosome partitioning or flagellar assembly
MGELDIANPVSIFKYKPDSKAAKEFEKLTQEILTKIGML